MYLQWAAVPAVFDPNQKAILHFCLIRGQCYLPVYKRLSQLAWAHSLVKPCGTVFIVLLSVYATQHSSVTIFFSSFPRKEEMILQALNTHLNITVWWLEIINELLNIMFCLYNIYSYLAFELHMNLLNHAFFFTLWHNHSNFTSITCTGV